uniref:Transposase n=1 Tax=Streptococcus suis TaxID=1307 RepID=G8DTS4_STRSU|nr:transposase [Streptococcus suis]
MEEKDLIEFVIEFQFLREIQCLLDNLSRCYCLPKSARKEAIQRQFSTIFLENTPVIFPGSIR